MESLPKSQHFTGATVFDSQLGRRRDGPAKFLKDWNGILQTDGYQLTVRWAGWLDSVSRLPGMSQRKYSYLLLQRYWTIY
jgi:hypothetical protein